MCCGRQICVKFFAVFLFTLVLLEYMWAISTTTPAKSLESIIAHRIELRDLETQLDQLLRATNHPLNEYSHTIHLQNEILGEYDEYFIAVEEYTTEYEKLNVEDMKGLSNTNELITNKIMDFIERHQKLFEERVALKTIAKRVLDVGEYSKSAWGLKKSMGIMAQAGIILDHEQEEVDDDDWENASNDAGIQRSKYMEGDDTCFAILQQLLKFINKFAHTERMIPEIDPLSAPLNAEDFIRHFVGNNTDPDYKSEIANLLRNKRRLIGKTKSFIRAATARVNPLLIKVIQKESGTDEEMMQAFHLIREKVVRCNQLLNKLTLNINHRLATLLDSEASQYEF